MKYYIYYQYNRGLFNQIFDKENGIGSIMVIEAEDIEQANEYLSKIGKCVDDFWSVEDECCCCGHSTIEDRWGDKTVKSRSEFKIINDYGDHITDHQTEGFFHTIGGKISPFSRLDFML